MAKEIDLELIKDTNLGQGVLSIFVKNHPGINAAITKKSY